ncbi:MAG TPA: transposase [Candidatus Acidoferrales bacterium]|nr:transposase [Candidatus Acidoferrales bacterium]
MAADFDRKNIRLPAENYRGRRLYFVTLCFENRRQFGADARLAKWLIARLEKQANAWGYFVHAYCVMPDHLHLLAGAAADASNLMAFVESFKQETGAEFARRAHRRLWQFKYYDRILRGSEPADRVAWYIWLNPVRMGYCHAAADYPFLGSFTELGANLLKGPRHPDGCHRGRRSPERGGAKLCRAEDRGATLNS